MLRLRGATIFSAVNASKKVFATGIENVQLVVINLAKMMSRVYISLAKCCISNCGIVGLLLFLVNSWFVVIHSFILRVRI